MFVLFGFCFEPWLAIKGKGQGQGQIFVMHICTANLQSHPPKLELLAALPQRLKKTLCRPDLLPHVAFRRSQCHTAAAGGAKLSTIHMLFVVSDACRAQTSIYETSHANRLPSQPHTKNGSPSKQAGKPPTPAQGQAKDFHRETQNSSHHKRLS